MFSKQIYAVIISKKSYSSKITKKIMAFIKKMFFTGKGILYFTFYCLKKKFTPLKAILKMSIGRAPR